MKIPSIFCAHSFLLHSLPLVNLNKNQSASKQRWQFSAYKYLHSFHDETSIPRNSQTHTLTLIVNDEKQTKRWRQRSSHRISISWQSGHRNTNNTVVGLFISETFHTLRQPHSSTIVIVVVDERQTS